MAPKKPVKKAAAKSAPAKPVAKAAAPMAKMAKNESCCMSSSCCSLMACCPLFQTLTTRAFWASSLLVFIVVMAFDMLFHGGYMMETYRATSSLWRAESEMQQFFPYCLVGHALLAMAYSAAVLLMGRTCSWWGALVTGIVAAAPLAINNAMAYIHLPLADAYIPTMWAVGSLAQGALAGLAVAAIKRCPMFCSSCCAEGSCCK